MGTTRRRYTAEYDSYANRYVLWDNLGGENGNGGPVPGQIEYPPEFKGAAIARATRLNEAEAQAKAQAKAQAQVPAEAPAGRDWTTMRPAEFGHAPDQPAQMAMFAAPDPYGTPDMTLF